MQRWEYALLRRSPESAEVGFTHQESWHGLASEEFWELIRRLGDDGWEMLATHELSPTDRSWYWFKRPGPA